MLKTFQVFKQYAGSSSNVHILTDEEIKKVQQVLLEIMDDFDALCRKHGLTYFLTGGSALGAEREKGFIPWDDDIDVMMPRQDYDKLPELVEKELNEKYWVQSLETSEKYDLCFSKFRKKGTQFVEIFETEPDKAGFFLDVFPLEDTYDNPVLRFLNGIIDETLFFVASCVRIHQHKDQLINYFNDKRVQQLILVKSGIGLLFDRGDKRKWYKRCEKWQGKLRNPTSQYVAVSCGRGHYFGETYKRSRIFPLQETDFEKRKYYIPGDIAHLLTKLYGKDYIKPISSDKIEKHAIVMWNSE